MQIMVADAQMHRMRMIAAEVLLSPRLQGDLKQYHSRLRPTPIQRPNTLARNLHSMHSIQTMMADAEVHSMHSMQVVVAEADVPPSALMRICAEVMTLMPVRIQGAASSPRVLVLFAL